MATKEQYLKSAKALEKKGLYERAGDMYGKVRNFDNALENYEKAVAEAEEAYNKNKLASTYLETASRNRHKIAGVYDKLGLKKKAKKENIKASIEWQQSFLGSF